MNWTLGKKFGAIFGATALVAAVLIYVSISGAGTMGQHVRTLEAGSRNLQMEGDLKAELANLRTAQRGVIMYTSAGLADKVEQNKTEFEAGLNRVRDLMASIRSLLVVQQAVQDVDAIGPALDQYAAAFNQIVDQCQHKDTKGALATATQAGTYGNEMQARAADLVEIAKKVASEAAAQAADAQSRMLIAAWVVALATLVTLAISVLLVRGVSRLLRALAGEMSQGAEQVANAASQVSSSSQSLAQGSSEQAASLEETSASSEEINSMARKNSENSGSAAELVTHSQQKFVEANQSLGQMVLAMGEIKTSSDRISKIIKTIDEIAFQTNILALNAAVEAARAGEAGMGFAVVADEVRSLAQRCAQAARDTASLIEESIAKSNDGKVKVDQVAAAIKAITEQAGMVRTLVDEVNLGSQEQARGIEQIGKAITQMEQVTQGTAANAEESAAAAEELNAQSKALKDIVARLKAMVGGGDGGNGDLRRRRPSFTRHAGGTPPRAGESAASLSALRAAVAHQPDGHAAEPVLAGVRADKNAFPLEAEFR